MQNCRYLLANLAEVDLQTRLWRVEVSADSIFDVVYVTLCVPEKMGRYQLPPGPGDKWRGIGGGSKREASSNFCTNIVVYRVTSLLRLR